MKRLTKTSIFLLALNNQIKDFVPRMQFTWNALGSILHEARRGTPSFVVRGTLDGRGLGQRITLKSVKEEDGDGEEDGEDLLPHSLASVSGERSALDVEFLYCSSEDDVADMQEEMNLRLEENLRSSLDSIHGFGTAALLPIICSCCTTKGSKSKELRVDGSLLLPSQRLTLQPIYPLLTCDTTLSRSLSSVLKKEKTQGVRPVMRDRDRTGFLSMDQGHRLLPLLENEPLAKEMPLLGVWVACGASGVRSPLVWAACLRFMYSKSIVERALQSGAFLLLLYASGSGAPQCFECTFEMETKTASGGDGLFSFKEKGLPACVRHSFLSEVYPEDLKEEEEEEEGGIVFSSDFGVNKSTMSEGANVDDEDRQPSSDFGNQSSLSSRTEVLPRTPARGTPAATAPYGSEVSEDPPVPRPSVPTPSHPTPSQNVFTPATSGKEKEADITDFLFSPYPPREVRKEIVFEEELSDLTNQPSYWSPYAQVPHSSTKLQGTAANFLISQQQEQLSLLQDQMKQLQQQLENVMKGSGNSNKIDSGKAHASSSSDVNLSPSTGEKHSVEMSADAEKTGGQVSDLSDETPIAQDIEEGRGMVSGQEKTEAKAGSSTDTKGDAKNDDGGIRSTVNDSEETTQGLRSASSSTSASPDDDHESSFTAAAGIDNTSDLGASIGPEALTISEAEAAGGSATFSSTHSSPGLSMSHSDEEDEEEEEGGEGGVLVGITHSAPAPAGPAASTYIPKVRYIPLSDEESEDEEELKILSKYLGQTNMGDFVVT